MSTDPMMHADMKGKRIASADRNVLITSSQIERASNRSLKPFRQGSLDAYCGLYAIANSMLRLAPEWFLQNEDEVCRLFRKMINCATKLCSPGELCFEGLDGNELISIADVAVRHMKKQGQPFKLLPWKSWDPKRPRVGVPELLEAAVNDTHTSVILHIEDGPNYHWSVLREIRGNRVHLFDSDATPSIRCDKCEPWLIIKNCKKTENRL